MRAAYESFLTFLRAARPDRPDQLQPGQRRALGGRAAPRPGFRYCEVWPPNDQWRHLEALMDRSSGRAGLLAPAGHRGRLVRAASPATRRCGVRATRRARSWARPGRPHCARCCVPRLWPPVSAPVRCSMATSAPCLRPVLPQARAPGSAAEAATASPGTASPCGADDLFLEGEDTSWYDIADENGAVALEWDGPCGPNPWAAPSSPGRPLGRLCRRQRPRPDRQRPGSWSEPTPPGRCRSVRARLLPGPGQLACAVATLGRHGDRFVPAMLTPARTGKGAPVEVEVARRVGLVGTAADKVLEPGATTGRTF